MLWVDGYWIITYVKKIWQYKCVHDIAYFNVLFGSEPWISYTKIAVFLGAANML